MAQEHEIFDNIPEDEFDLDAIEAAHNGKLATREISAIILDDQTKQSTDTTKSVIQLTVRDNDDSYENEIGAYSYALDSSDVPVKSYRRRKKQYTMPVNAWVDSSEETDDAARFGSYLDEQEDNPLGRIRGGPVKVTERDFYGDSDEKFQTVCEVISELDEKIDEIQSTSETIAGDVATIEGDTAEILAHIAEIQANQKMLEEKMELVLSYVMQLNKQN